MYADNLAFSKLDSRVTLGALTGFRTNRRFTDLFCCLSYLLLVGACVGLVFYNQENAVKNFQVLRDSDHKPCTKPYDVLYFPTPSLDRSVCVTSCPKQAGKPMNCKPNSQFRTCPTSIAGIVDTYETDICHHPAAQIPPLTSISRTINNSVFHAQETILRVLRITALAGLFIVLTVLVFPSLVYLYALVFESIMVIISAACFYRYFAGKLPFFHHGLIPDQKASLYALGAGVLFLIGAIVSLVILVSRFPTLRFTIKIIKAARLLFFDNPLIILNSVIVTLLSIGVFYLNFWLYRQIQSFGFIDNSSKGLDQYQAGPVVHLLRALFLLQVFWTHGLINSLSHFLFQSHATLWYYGPILGTDTLYSFFSTAKLVFWHFGTICFGSTYTYHFQTCTNTLITSQQCCNPNQYGGCCYLHNSCFRYLSIYGFIPTILEGLPFWPANNIFSPIKSTAERTYTQMYMQGNFFTNSAKFFLTVLSVLIAFVLLRSEYPALYNSFRVLLVPLLITALFANEIATSWLDATGTTGDTMLFNYVIERNFGQQFGLGYFQGNPGVIQVLREKVQMPVMAL